jgi:hypothetical protein
MIENNYDRNVNKGRNVFFFPLYSKDKFIWGSGD